MTNRGGILHSRYFHIAPEQRKFSRDCLLEEAESGIDKENDDKKDDEWAKEKIRKLLGLENGTLLQTYDRTKRNEAIKIMKNAGISIRQIERLTGITKGVIQKIK